MQVLEKVENGKTIYTVSGRIDTLTSSEFQEKISLSDKMNVEFDMKDVDYISSVGLRVFLAFQKEINAKAGELQLTHVQPQVKEVFQIVGFDSFIQLS